MGAPQGYTALGLVGYTDKGTYLASATYNRYNVVLYNGSSYVAIKDGITGITPSNDGVNWRLFANGFPENGISTDNFQETLKQYISNTGTVNQEGFALDARQANPNVEGSMAAQLNTLSSGISPIYVASSSDYVNYWFLKTGKTVFFQIYNSSAASNIEPNTVVCQVPVGWNPDHDYIFMSWVTLSLNSSQGGYTFGTVALSIKQNRDMILEKAYFRGGISGFFCIS